MTNFQSDLPAGVSIDADISPEFAEILTPEALALVADMAERVGFHAVCVDAIDETAAMFYEKHGFIALRDQPRKLFYPVSSISRG